MWGGGYILHVDSSFSVYFLILKCKISKIPKIFACGALIFNVYIFRFKTDASKFSFSRSSFFSPFSGHEKPVKP